MLEVSLFAAIDAFRGSSRKGCRRYRSPFQREVGSLKIDHPDHDRLKVFRDLSSFIELLIRTDTISEFVVTFWPFTWELGADGLVRIVQPHLDAIYYS